MADGSKVTAGPKSMTSLDECFLDVLSLGQLPQVVAQQKIVIGPSQLSRHRPNHADCLGNKVLLRIG